jgi:hypothetical protein
MVIDSTDKCTSRCGMQRHVLYGCMSLTYRRSPNDRVRLANATIEPESPASSRSFAWLHVSFCSNSIHEPMIQWPARYQALVSIGNPQLQKKQEYWKWGSFEVYISPSYTVYRPAYALRARQGYQFLFARCIARRTVSAVPSLSYRTNMLAHQPAGDFAGALLQAQWHR